MVVGLLDRLKKTLECYCIVCEIADNISSRYYISSTFIMIKNILYSALFIGLSSYVAHADAGKAAYVTCSTCHSADGQGLAIGDKKMAPSLTGSKIINGDPSVLALVILKGVKKEGTQYMGMMAPLELVYKDDQKLADLLTYIRSSFGNNAPAVTVEEVGGFRTKWADRKTPITRAELEALAK